MHIVMITDDFPPLIGGMATHAWELSKALVKLGHQLTVLTGAECKAKKRRFMLETVDEQEGVRIINFGFKFIVLRRYYNDYFRVRIHKHLNRIATGTERVVLHLHNFMPPKIRRKSDMPIIWTNHSSIFLKSFEDASLTKNLEEIVQPFDWITAPSRELLEKTIRLGYPEHRTTYIPNGVDVGRFDFNHSQDERCFRLGGVSMRFPEDRCVVLCARRFVYKNGLHVYLDALESMTKVILSKCTFLFAGNQSNINSSYEREFEREIVERIRKLSRKTDCQLLGIVPNDNMPDLYRIADISVLPSLVEATSITGLESMASGIPIVGTNVGGIPEIVENKVTGLLCQPNDPNGLAKNLETLINSTSLRKQLGSEGRKVAQARFSWNVIAQRFLTVYESAMNHHYTVAQ